MRNALLLLLCTVCCVAQAQPRSGFADMKPGAHGVGFRVIQQYDHARSFKDKIDPMTGKPTRGERARPIQTLVWYPAYKAGTPMRFADYMRTEASDEVFERSEGETAEFMARTLKWATNRLGAAAAKATFEQAMWAVRDAAPAAGKFPVVIYAAGGGGAAHEASDMGEYLASHGYLVIASRNMGARTRAMKVDHDDIDAQVRDIQFLISYARTLPQADMTHVAAAGWSWGGMTNLFAAARDNRITALVSLDGTRNPDFTRPLARAHIALPWLYVSRQPSTIPELNRKGIETSFSLLNEMKSSEVYQLTMYPMEHDHFSAVGMRFSDDTSFTEYSRAEVKTAYGWTMRYVLEFLNAYTKGSHDGLEFMSTPPRQHGVPAHTIKLQRAGAEGPPPGRGGMAAELGKRGFGHAMEVYRAMQKRDPAFALSANEINDWGYTLLQREKDMGAAIAIFQFGTALFPADGNLFDSLAEAHEENSDKPAAIKHYRRALELDPNNGNAIARLKELEQASIR